MIVYKELSSIETDLGIKARTLYAVSNSLDRHYRQVRLEKHDGSFRLLSVPDPVLKIIQKKITLVLLSQVEVSPYATAYRPGGSTAANALPHVKKDVVLKLDIHHFFDNILYSDVKEKAFPPEKYSEPIRVLLSMLCYYNDGLPQGAPSSPAISNIVMKDFDERVGAWCENHGVNYTRYCDDLTFSGNFDYDEVARFVTDELRKEGFFLNAKKTHVARNTSKQTVTGLVVNKKLNVPTAYRRAIRQEIYFCRKYGVEEHLRRSGKDCTAREYISVLCGKVSYVLSVCPGNEEFVQYREYLSHEVFV